ncbi:MAG: DNA polymerase III subunit alpha [Saprospiraceae bacterium]
MYLNCHSHFSLRYGTLPPENLVQAAKRWGITALALTDINNTSCTGEFIKRCTEAGIKPLVGIDFRTKEGERRYVGIARNAEGFAELNRYLTHFSLADKPLPEVFDPSFIIHHSSFIIIYPKLVKPIDQFKDYEYLGIRPEHVHRLFSAEVRHFPKKLLMFSPATFLDDEGYELHRILRAIDQNELLSRLDPKSVAKKTERLHPPEVLLDFYKVYPGIIENTKRLVDSCHIELETGDRVNRRTFTGSKDGDMALLKKLALTGVKSRYHEHDPTLHRKAMQRIEKELAIIQQMDFGAYFLIAWDVIRYAHSVGVHHVGRGSGANSIVAFCLRITDVDPLELDLYFERFINPHRTSPPDFDLDFSWDERDDVTDYIFKRYGKEHTALLATYSTFQFNAAVRELGKVYGLPKAEIDTFIDDVLTLTGTRDVRYWKEEDGGRLTGDGGQQAASLPSIVSRPPSTAEKPSPVHLQSEILKYARRLHGFPNYLSIHAGGILIAEKPLACHTALQMMPKGFPVTHFDMYHGEELGFHKLDILSQRGLGHVKDAVDLVKRNQGKAVDIHDITAIKQDARVKAQLRSGQCIGCFYVESPAMRGLLKKLRCEEYIHLVAASSIIRPGVAQSGMMKEYIRRFHSRFTNNDLRLGPNGTPIVNRKSEIVNPETFYLHPVFKEHLGETFGVMVYQEDVIKILHHFAGLGLGESDVLRRVMNGKKADTEQYKNLERKYFTNCKQLDHPDELAAEVWRQIKSFAGYSFCKAHSASFAVESFQSLYLKAYFPLEFMVAVINNFGGFYKTEYYFHEARMAGATIHAPCVNRSLWLTNIEGRDIFIGFVHLRGMEQKVAHRIVHQRTVGGPFRSLADFVNRVDIGAEQLELLIRIGAFRFTGLNKYELMWEKNAVFNPKIHNGTTNGTGLLFEDTHEHFSLPNLAEGDDDQAFDEIELLGFALRPPFELLVENNHYDCILAKNLPQCTGKMVNLLGYYVCKKDVRTVKNDLMCFGTWLDEEGHFFDTTHFPNFLKMAPFRGKGVYKITGKVAEEYGFPSVEVVKMERLAFRVDGRYGE